MNTQGERGDTCHRFFRYPPPGLAGWGAKSAATVLARYGSIEAIPDDEKQWDVQVRGATKLATTLREQRELALLFKKIATVITNVPVGSVDEWRWQGPTSDFADLCKEMGQENLAKKAAALAPK